MDSAVVIILLKITSKVFSIHLRNMLSNHDLWSLITVAHHIGFSTFKDNNSSLALICSWHPFEVYMIMYGTSDLCYIRKNTIWQVYICHQMDMKDIRKQPHSVTVVARLANNLHTMKILISPNKWCCRLSTVHLVGRYLIRYHNFTVVAQPSICALSDFFLNDFTSFISIFQSVKNKHWRERPSLGPGFPQRLSGLMLRTAAWLGRQPP